MNRISLAAARTMIDGAFTAGRARNLAPLSVAVLDAGGHLVAFEREDGSSNLRPAIAIAKASGALALGVSSRKIGAMAVERPSFVAALGAIAPDGVVPAAGGLLVTGADALIGAIGVTGDTSDNDEICGLAGIAAAGLKTLE